MNRGQKQEVLLFFTSVNVTTATLFNRRLSVLTLGGLGFILWPGHTIMQHQGESTDQGLPIAGPKFWIKAKAGDTEGMKNPRPN